MVNGVIRNLKNQVDSVWIYDDGSTKNLDGYDELFKSLPGWIKVHRAKKNKGVGAAKNWVMQQLLDEDCYCIFVGEDDIVPVSKRAITGYIKASRETGITHFMFAHHGPINKVGPNHREGIVETYPGCVGGWCFFTKPALEEVGLHDEEMVNAYEHVELTWRLAQARRTTPWGYFADVKGSKDWLQEISDSIENSSISKTEDWALRTCKALVHWRDKDPNFPLQHTLDGISEELKKKAKEAV